MFEHNLFLLVDDKDTEKEYFKERVRGQVPWFDAHLGWQGMKDGLKELRLTTFKQYLHLLSAVHPQDESWGGALFEAITASRQI